MSLHVSLHSLGLLTMMTASLALGACGDSGGGSTETSNGPATNPSTSEPTTTGASSTTATEATTSPTEATSDPTTTGPTTGPTTGMTTGMTTGPTTGMTTGPTTGDDTTAGTGDTGSTGSTGDTTTGGELIPCKTDKDCTLVDDCCHCEPIGPGETLECDIQECLINSCAGPNLENAPLECRFGRCTFATITCNPLGVNCNTPEPACAPGEVARVEENNAGKCWTGDCVPAEACDWVPDCSYCDEPELVCVFKLQKGAYHVCEPKPIDCGDSDNIDCECGQQICDASPPHTECIDADDDINCECPFC